MNYSAAAVNNPRASKLVLSGPPKDKGISKPNVPRDIVSLSSVAKASQDAKDIVKYVEENGRVVKEKPDGTKVMAASIEDAKGNPVLLAVTTLRTKHGEQVKILRAIESKPGGKDLTAIVKQARENTEAAEAAYEVVEKNGTAEQKAEARNHILATRRVNIKIIPKASAKLEQGDVQAATDLIAIAEITGQGLESDASAEAEALRKDLKHAAAGLLAQILKLKLEVEVSGLMALIEGNSGILSEERPGSESQGGLGYIKDLIGISSRAFENILEYLAGVKRSIKNIYESDDEADQKKRLEEDLDKKAYEKKLKQKRLDAKMKVQKSRVNLGQVLAGLKKLQRRTTNLGIYIPELHDQINKIHGMLFELQEIELKLNKIENQIRMVVEGEVIPRLAEFGKDLDLISDRLDFIGKSGKKINEWGLQKLKETKEWKLAEL